LTKSRRLRELSIMVVTCLAIYHAGRSIYSSIERQLLLHSQASSLKGGLKQAEEVNQDLRDGLTNYRSSNGLERLARERLNLAGQDEIIVRLGK
jgi:cell division protein FtsB